MEQLELHVFKTFVGMSQVVARPMTRGEYNHYRGWDLPDNENGDDEGVLVRNEALNHVSWLPVDVFMATYVPTGDISDLADFQQRVVGELAWVSLNVWKLNSFISSAKFRALDEEERSKLNYQLSCMISYQQSLQDRVADFQSKPVPAVAPEEQNESGDHESA